MKNKIISIILLLLCLITLTSCYDYAELEREVLIFSLGIDKNNDDYEISVETLSSNDEGGQVTIKPKIISSRGHSIYEALSKLDGKFNNKVNLSHCTLIIIGDDYAKQEGIKDVLNLVFEENNLRFNTILTTTQNATAKDILLFSEKEQIFHGFEIMEQISKNNLFNDNARAYKIINYIQNKGVEVTLPVVEIAKDNNDKNFYSDKIALFDEYNLKGYIENKYTKYYAFLLNKKDSLEFKLNINNNIVNSKLTLKDIKDEIKNDELNIDITFNAMIESNDNNVSKKIIKQKLEEEINKEIYSFISNIKNKYKIDIFGYGYKIKNYKLKNSVKDWNEYFANLTLKTSTTINISEFSEE